MGGGIGGEVVIGERRGGIGLWGGGGGGGARLYDVHCPVSENPLLVALFYTFIHIFIGIMQFIVLINLLSDDTFVKM